MKFKMLALILALTVASWAQTTTPATPSTPQPSTEPADKAKSGDKMAPADAKDAAACCAHHDMKSTEIMEQASCCGGKNATATGAMSCMRNRNHKTAASCCKEGCGKDSCAKDKTASACCKGKDGKGCCSGKKMEKTAKTCCQEELPS